ncbi:MAG: hypothetical protein ABSG37_10765 [Candidatus Limnocylindrales bacterium]
MSAPPPETRRPEGQVDPERENPVRAWATSARIAMVLAVVLIALFVLAILILDPDLLRRWLSVDETSRLFGGPTPSL